MSAKKQKPPRLAAKKHEPDWAALDALTDEEIAAQIAADSDVAPEWDWPLDDPGVRIMVPTDSRRSAPNSACRSSASRKPSR